MRCLVVFDSAKDKPIIFSSFQPDAAQSILKLQTTYPGPIQLDSVQCGYHVMRYDL
ncbi:hypothetical protein LguiA_033611 [Lonicera macranthoides]